jgi:hypothetical protein
MNAAISGSILAGPDACFVMMMALPLGSTRAFATAQDIRPLATILQRAIGQLAFCRLDRADQLHQMFDPRV